VRHLSLDAESGVEVMSVEKGGPAEAAGFLTGDVLLDADGTRLSHLDALLRALAQWTPGKRMAFSVLRGAKKISIDAAPRESA
jgi:S1-C subfamily serine protease